MLASTPTRRYLRAILIVLSFSFLYFVASFQTEASSSNYPDFSSMETILVTGGAGFIGSHTCVELLNSGHGVIVVDNLSNSSPEALKRVEEITGKKLKFIEGDVRDEALMDKVFTEHKIHGVIHFAGLKAVGESVQIPLKYYENNLVSTMVLLKAMEKHNVMNLVFSSSATVYGVPQQLPLDEDHPLSATNPYGQTKLMIENMLMDLTKAPNNKWKICALRYFNPIGAHPSGRIGEDPADIPNNLMPYISQVAIGKLPHLNVFGDDYDTPDGTGVRDYIHVVDLAQAHLAAIENLKQRDGYLVYNVGTGQGYSVLEMVDSMRIASGKEIPFKIAPRRPGDVGSVYAAPDKAKNEMKWEAKLGLKQMCEDVWRWQSNNPNGYRK